MIKQNITFFIDIGVNDIHYQQNNILIDQLDSTNIKGSSPIDTIAYSNGLVEFVEGCKLVGNNEILFSDYKAYTIDINLEEYFQE